MATETDTPALPDRAAGAVKEGHVTQFGHSMPTGEYQGKWIAWDEGREAVAASADTYPELMRLVSTLGLSDPFIEKAPGIHPVAAARRFTLLPDESPDILDDVRKTIPDPDEWLDTPNTRLWCQKPRDLVGTGRERQLRYLLRGIRSGIAS